MGRKREAGMGVEAEDGGERTRAGDDAARGGGRRKEKKGVRGGAVVAVRRSSHAPSLAMAARAREESARARI
jgi:hypothetical protein